MLLNAKVQEVVDFVCNFMQRGGTWIKTEKYENDTYLLIFRLKFVQGGIENYFEYGHATVSPWIDQNTLFHTKLNFPHIYDHADGDLLKVEQWKEKFQGDFAELRLELQKSFGERKKVRGKRRKTAMLEQRIIAEYTRQLQRKKSEFRQAFRREDVSKVKVTAKEVYDGIGDKLGVGVRRIQQVLNDHKKKQT